jgi:5-methylthioadenosine/S-adenosylhomocysteine deaminase
MTQTLIKNANIVSMDSNRSVYLRGSILIENDKIIEIGRYDDFQSLVDSEVAIEDVKDNWVLPGLINTHVHTSQQLARGIADDVDLLVWLRDRIWPYESNLSEEDSYISSLLCGVEQIRSGVTCFVEAGGQHVNGMGRAVKELGIRAVLVKSTMDTGIGLPKVWQNNTQEEIDAQIENFENWHNKANDRIRYWFGLRTIFNNSDDLILKTKELADKYDVGIHMHVAEIKDEIEFSKNTRGSATVTHLNNLGVLGSNFLAAHCVWMSDKEIEIFQKNNVKVTHNPAAAMKVLGFAEIPQMLEQGICVSIGTDGAPCNNRMSLIDEMWLTSLIHKGRKLNSKIMPAETVLEMVTINAAKCALWDKEIGSLEKGKKADLIIIDPKSATMLPMHDPIANLVSSMRTQNVNSVMCDGNWVMKEGVIKTIDEDLIIKESIRRSKDIIDRANIRIPSRFNFKSF